jgi:large subunit ribosomal protein L19
MNTLLSGVVISPVNMTDRKNLGIRAGDTVRVHQKIQDKGKTRLQVFEGVVLARKHGAEAGATFTVRKVASGVGVEKIFPLYSPNIDKIEIVKRAHVRRAKLYYIREKVAREIKRQMRRMSLVSMGTLSDTEEAARIEAEEKAAAAAEAAIAAELAKKAEAEKAAADAEVKAAEAEKVEEVSAEAVAEATPSEEPKA